MPHVSVVTKLTLGEGTLTAERQIEGALEVHEASLPCVVTAQKGLNEPRYPSLKGIMAAKKKPLETVDLPEVASRCVVKSLGLPPARSAVTMIDATPEGMKTLLTALRNEKKVL